MKKPILTALIIIGLGAIAFGYWTISPLFIDVRVSEEMPAAPTAAEMTILAEGEFVGLEGHDASGKAEILEIGGKRYVRFEEDFKVTNGPDLFVYLGKLGEYDPAANLGALKGNIGSQNYEIPENFNLEEYDSVWVWCRAFRVAFGVANF
jgi:hypothetical protein